MKLAAGAFSENSAFTCSFFSYFILLFHTRINLTSVTTDLEIIQIIISFFGNSPRKVFLCVYFCCCCVMKFVWILFIWTETTHQIFVWALHILAVALSFHTIVAWKDVLVQNLLNDPFILGTVDTIHMTHALPYVCLFFKSEISGMLQETKQRWVYPSCPLNPPLGVLNFTSLADLPYLTIVFTLHPSFCEIAFIKLHFSVMSLICIDKSYMTQSLKICPSRDIFKNVHSLHCVKKMQRCLSLFSERGKLCFSLTTEPSGLLLLEHLWSLPSRCQ